MLNTPQKKTPEQMERNTTFKTFKSEILMETTFTRLESSNNKETSRGWLQDTWLDHTESTLLSY